MILPGIVASSTAEGLPSGGFVLGVTKPDDTNTGIDGPTTSTDNSADITLGAGTPIHRVLFNGNVRFTAPRQLVNCRIRGKTSTTSQNTARIDQTITGGYVELERCTLDNRYHPTNGGNGGHGGIRGPYLKTTRCNISGGHDGIGLLSPGFVYSYGDYIHDLWFSSPDSQHTTDGSHCDGIQGHGQSLDTIEVYGSNIEGLLNNSLPNAQGGFSPAYSGSALVSGHPWFDAYETERTAQGHPDDVPWGTSGILFGYTAGARLDNLWIHDGWITGGGYACINFDPRWVASNTSNLVIERMRVGALTRDQSGGRPWLVICKNTLPITIADNVNEDDDTPNNSRRNG